MKQIDEADIIGRVLGGDREAFADLVEAYKGPVFRLAFRMTGSAQDADDLSQQIFLRAFETLGRFRRGERFFPWLYTVALNVIRSHLRRSKALPEAGTGHGAPEAEDPRGNPADAAAGRERSRRIQGYLLRLNPSVREILVLRFYEGMSFEDIAGLTGNTPGGVKMKAYRGLEKIRVMMEKDGFADDEARR
ncbi:MAG: ECF RNA polymerase sigma factor SigW [Syntrophaceae bacterium PtaB.Bin038]|jgi:RNA polymerase sigma-70 factor (ECF subfamily)|nr:MAG: ECF RNA polymerase sigma factor SigW [Syntrophaceae bacterium PtaB.Bin038]